MTIMMTTMMTTLMTTMKTLRKVLVGLVIPGRSAKDKGNGDPAKNSNDNNLLLMVLMVLVILLILMILNTDCLSTGSWRAKTFPPDQPS